MQQEFEGPDPHSDSVLRSDELLQETSGVDRWNKVKTDFIGPLHWFSAATDQIARLSQKGNQGLDEKGVGTGAKRSRRVEGQRNSLGRYGEDDGVKTRGQRFNITGKFEPWRATGGDVWALVWCVGLHLEVPGLQDRLRCFGLSEVHWWRNNTKKKN